MKLSVVVPVYNADKYLRQCLDSIRNQDLTDIEIIAVNDGSTDSSGLILDEYAKNDPRIKVIYQQNQGAGPARNHGLEYACGNYVTFFDSDDFMPGNCLKAAYEFAESRDADIAVFGKEFYHDDTGEFEPSLDVHAFPLPPYGTVFSIQDDPDRFLLMFNGMICSKFFKREFLEQTGIKFMSLPNSNDVTFVICNLISAQKVVCSDIKIWIYRVGTGTSITDGRERNPLCALYASEAIYDFASIRSDFSEIKHGVANFNAQTVNQFLLTYKTAPAFKAFYTALRREGLEHMGLIDLPKDYIYSRFIGNELRHIRRSGPMMPNNAKNSVGFWRKVTFAVPGISWFFSRLFKNGLKETIRRLKGVR